MKKSVKKISKKTIKKKKPKSAIAKYVWQLRNKTNSNNTVDLDDEAKAKRDSMFSDRRGSKENSDRRTKNDSPQVSDEERRFNTSRRSLRKKFMDNWYLSSSMNVEEIDEDDVYTTTQPSEKPED